MFIKSSKQQNEYVYICDKAIKESKSTVNTQCGRVLASGVKEGDIIEEGHGELHRYCPGSNSQVRG